MWRARWKGNVSPTVRWRKSSYSGEESNCVEVGRAPGVVSVRDSKAPRSATLAFTPRHWSTFLGSLTRSETGRPA
ncbi:DUF397 domain-containing protein [Saccharopolyspora sp. NFXS83]|uniref:DUF397 domain-containing protein n=1 Tax=Saccharopolyspora sp. NFXS83 TaxID=2993560 RepID=UPI00224B110A|nr:DUF397 domain-containing protein [Saccharopolyspora sp. NFXS83]MCX2728884.1 DUF397 domain-containing protein [Saccharopolyspora sp. NFXS83]